MSWREKIAKVIAPGLKDEAEMRSLMESVAEEAVKKAGMALPITANYDPKGEGYRPYSSGGMAVRDLVIVQQQRMFEIAYFMFDSSAMTRRLAIMDKSFLFSKPITIKHNDTDAQAIIDTFWKENKLQLNYPNWALWFSLLGELLRPVTVNPFNGAVSMTYIGPELIKEVFVSQLDVTQRVRIDTMNQDGRDDRRMPVIRKDPNSKSKTYGRLVGECFFHTLNNPPNAARGRSDFLTLFDWIDGLERYGFNFLERAEFMLNFIWDVLLKGMDANQIKEWLRDNPVPMPGSMRAHNENVEWNAVAPDLKQQDHKAGFDMGKAFIMGAAGRPDSWFGQGGKVYSTEAAQIDQVPVRDLEERSNFHQSIITEDIQFVLDQAVIAGRLSTEKADSGFKVTMPEISKMDMTKILAGLTQGTAGLQIAQTNRWVTTETAMRIFAFIISYLGYDIDPEKEKEEMEKKPPADEVDYENKYLNPEGDQGGAVAK